MVLLRMCHMSKYEIGETIIMLGKEYYGSKVMCVNIVFKMQ